MKVLVLGAGQVANAVVAQRAGSHEVVMRGRAQVDLVDALGVERMIQAEKPHWVVNAAAYTAVDLAEDRAAQAVAVNDTAVGTLAAVAAEVGCRLLHLSTDYVFDGRSSRAYLTDDPTNPMSVYGSSKLGGERHVLATPSGVIVRTSWVYASIGSNFVLTMLRLMRDKPQLSVVCDQIGAPTWAMSLGAAIWRMVDAGITPGVYHWTDLGVASWYDFAVAIQEEALARGLLTRHVPIIPISSALYPTKARRPAFSILDTASTRDAIHLMPRHWRENLRMMLDELRTA